MNKRMILATAASVAALVAGTVTASAQASTTKPNDCNRVATADHLLCLKVQLQHPYGRSFDGKRENAWTEPSGKKIVYTITHSGYTKQQMHDSLKLEADEYKYNVTDVPVSMDAITFECGDTNGQWVVSFVDADGKPGGTQLTYKHIVCN